MALTPRVIDHYARGDLLARIEAALRQAGKDPAHPSVDDLAGVDEFYSRGREATVELAELLPPALDTELLDIGSGIGGPARFLTATLGYRAVGVDLTPEYVEVTNELTRRCGLSDRVRFLAANALALPFAAGEFAAAYTQHAAMNIEDKPGLYRELARVLRLGATLVVFDILQGPGGQVRYPTPWSTEGSTSFLVDLPTLQLHPADAGFEVVEHRDCRAESVAWFEARAVAAAANGGPPPLSLRLLLGPVFKDAFANLITNLREGRAIPTCVRAIRH